MTPEQFLAAARAFFGSVEETARALVPPIGRCPLDDEQRAFVMGIKEGWRAPGP